MSFCSTTSVFRLREEPLNTYHIHNHIHTSCCILTWTFNTVNRAWELWHYFMCIFICVLCYSSYAVRLPLPISLSVLLPFFPCSLCVHAALHKHIVNWLLFTAILLFRTLLLLIMVKFISKQFVFCCNGFYLAFYHIFFFMHHCT